MRFSKLPKRLSRDQRGFAVPTALLMTIAATGIVTVGLFTTVRVQSGTTRDQATKSALEIAEAGVSHALLHYNRIEASPTNPCSPVSASGPASGWCGPITGSFSGGSYSYYVATVGDALDIVATGDEGGGATRRVHVTAHSSSGQGIFSEFTVQGKDGINLNSNAEIRAGSATNGSITMSSNAKLCGPAQVGVGKELVHGSNTTHTSDPACTQPTSTVGEDDLSLPTVNQGDADTNNDNFRFFTENVVSGNKASACWNGLKANGQSGSCGARHLDVRVNSAVTLRGGKYSFCRLTMSSNSALYIAAGESVTIYFDSPEACGLSAGTTQLELLSNSRITSNDGGPANVALLFVGSSTTETTILLNSNTTIGAACQQNFVIYAPRTDIELDSNATYCGALAGNTIQIDSNARIFTDASAQNFVLPNTAPHYEVTRFVECSSTPSSPPNPGC